MGGSLVDPARSELDAQLLPHAQDLLRDWCGDIHVSGHEITMRNPQRADQSWGSFKFNTQTGAWSDFAIPDFKGYGLTLLYANIKDQTIGKAVAAMQALIQDSGLQLNAEPPTAPPFKPKVESVDPGAVIKPPDVHPDLGYPSMTWEYRDSGNRLSFHVYRFDNDGKKETRPVAWSAEKNAWLWQYPSPPYPLYHLPDLLEKTTATVIVTEGEKAADAAAKQFPDAVVITSACGSEQALRTDWTALKGRDVIIAPDNDAPGKHYALSVAGAALVHGAKSVKVIDVWQMTDWDAGDDLADHQVAGDFLERAKPVLELFEASKLEPYVVKASAMLSRGDLDRNKRRLADLLCIGVRTLEALVKEARTKAGEGAAMTEVTDQGFEDDSLLPWEEAVNGDQLFTEVLALINRYLILSKAQSSAVAVWIVFSYAFESMRICPQLLINSPSKRCGKSTLLELIMYLVLRALPAANISSAAVFRSIQAWKPTLLIDEADTFLNSTGNDEITGILNSGHNQSLAFVVRTQEVDGEHVPVRFSTFCPKVIAMIKAPADTIIDRSIVITLVRKRPDQHVDALAIDAKETLTDTRRRILRWSADHRDEVKFDIEDVPAMGNDRARQNWAVLAAFAKAMGTQAYAALLNAASELSDTSDVEENVEVELLTDLRDLVLVCKTAHIQSGYLVKELVKLKERPWGEINRGGELTENKLARMLRPFKVSPEKFRDGAVTHRGYSVPALKAVFDRYLVNQGKEAA